MCETNWCQCKGHQSRDFSDLTDFYSLHFIPDGWTLEYTTLNDAREELVLYLVGSCDRCGGFMRSGVSIACCRTTEALFSKVYQTMRHRRPYDTKEQSGTYHGGCVQRAQWYWEQDHLTAPKRAAQFVSLFHKEDQDAAKRWVEKYFSTMTVRRDTASEMFLGIVGLVQNEGLWPGQSTFITYTPNTSLLDPTAELTDYRFTLWPELNFSANGEVYIDCVLYGTFDTSGRNRLHIGSIRASSDDRDTCLTMGSLSGALLYYGKAYVEANKRRYTPEAELQASCDANQNTSEKGADEDA
jgi:hypothetical protein